MPTLIAITLLVLSADPRPTPTAMRPEQLLLNMPVNSDRRCVGISLVGAALLEGERLSDGQGQVGDPRELGGRIFAAAFTKSRVQYPERLRVVDRDVPIQSREGLDALTTAVADCYKERHVELIATEEGRNKLWAAEKKVLRDVMELDALLEADLDHVIPLLAIGSRRFPDGNIKATNHAVLFARQASGERVVFVANDPGQPIACRFAKSGEGLLVFWTCRYRDTGQTTSQYYYLIETDQFFRTALAR
jgi:hypothetical protein